jgi:hypothetical protein
MKPDRPATGRGAEDLSGPRLGLCQILAQRRESAQPRTPSSEGLPLARAPITRLPIRLLTRQ